MTPTSRRPGNSVREDSGDNPPIVLMHGFPDDHTIYERLLPSLGPRRAVVSIGMATADPDAQSSGYSP